MKFEDSYKHQIDQKDKLNSELSLPLGLLVALGGLLGVMLQSAWFDFHFLSILFSLAVTASALFFCATMYFLVRSYSGHSYMSMPFPLEQKAYRDELRQWHTTYGNGPADGDSEWELFMEDSYANAADFNARVNQVKSEYLFRARGTVVACAVSTVLAFVPFAIHRALSPTPPQRIKVINQERPNRGKLVTEDNTSMPEPAKQQSQAPPPPKPQAPPLRVLKEGTIPKKK